MKPSVIGAVFALSGAILFSAKAVFVKWAYQYGVDPISLLSLRMIFSLPFFIGVAIYMGQDHKSSKMSRREIWSMIALGLIGYYLASLFDFLGLQYITASLERLILFVYPTIVLILAAIFFKRPIRRFQYYALLLTYVGIATAFADKLDWASQKSLFIGTIFIFAAALAYAVYLIGSEKLIGSIGAVRFTAIAMIAACVGVILHQLIVNQELIVWSWRREVYILALCIAIISTVIPSFLFSKGIQYIGASHTAVIASAGPISTIMLAWYFLDEHISIWQFAGTGLVLLGVGMITFHTKKAKKLP